MMVANDLEIEANKAGIDLNTVDLPA
jgi:hypothetical protein